MKFEKFLKDNDAKRSRANKKAQDEVRQREGKEAEISGLEGDLERLTAAKEKIKSALERSGRYDKYLEMVAESSDEFPEVNDLLMRHETLTAANLDLLENVKEHTDAVEATRAEMAAYIKEKQNSILVGNSEIAELQKKLEAYTRSVEHLEQILAEKGDFSKGKVRQLGEINMAINNLYSFARIRHPPDNETLMGKLVATGMRIVDLQDIVAKAPATVVSRAPVTSSSGAPSSVPGTARDGARSRTTTRASLKSRERSTWSVASKTSRESRAASRASMTTPGIGAKRQGNPLSSQSFVSRTTSATPLQ